MDFKPVGPEDLTTIYGYTSRFGEGSCQHSPVSMWSLYEKYGDAWCEKDGFLYVCREHMCADGYRVYMAPFGDGDLHTAYDAILDDAHAHGCKARFHTLTRTQAEFLEEAYPGIFESVNDRDYAEYIYSVQTMLEFPGKIHARRRTEIRAYWRDYGDRTTVAPMCAADLDEVAAYALEWLRINSETHDEAALEREMCAIRKQIAHFDELQLTGTVIRVDGAVKAFCYGVPLNDKYYDVLIEKGDREFPGIYRVLRQESTKLNLTGFEHINFEEDLGVPGLRRIKESYGPEFMIDKYRIREL